MPGTYNALRILFEEILKMSDKEIMNGRMVKSAAIFISCKM
jgi:bisphosphoglycerate-dependent phosphoglycerate mutase